MNENEEKKELTNCVVWTRIPILTWLFPFLGHVGICDSKGVIYDFEGPKYVGHGKLLFGEPIEKWELDIEPEILDNSIKEAEEEFKNRYFSMLCSNCHFFVATALKNANYKQKTLCCVGFDDWTFGATFKIALSLVFHGRSIKWNSKLSTWVCTLILWGIIVFIVLLINSNTSISN